MTSILGVLEGRDEMDPCACGCPAKDHAPCCGACTNCGTNGCAEFRLEL